MSDRATLPAAMAISTTLRYFLVRLIAIRFDDAIRARIARWMRPRPLLMSPLSLSSATSSPFPKSALARNRSFRRNSRWPQRGEGRGKMRRGQRRADHTGESASTTRGNKTTMLLCCRSPSRRIRQGCKRRVGPATACNIPIAASVAGHRLHDMTRRARNCVVSLRPGQASSGRHREFVLTPRPVSEGGRWHAWPSVRVRSGSK
jgi:hypothetical protein